MSYTTFEYADMHLIYGECHGNSTEAALLYQRRFPNRQHPNATTFRDLHLRLRETGSVLRREEGGRPLRTRTVAVEEAVIRSVEENPTTSCRTMERSIPASRSVINRVLRDNGYYPFHRTRVQDLHPGDRPLRINFCRKLLELATADDNFLKTILWTDESLFTREGSYNSHNYHNYDLVNPHFTVRRAFQRRFKVNVWAGILGDHILLYNMPDYVNGNQYYVFLSEVLPVLLNQLPDGVRPRTFQHDGAPSHNVRIVTGHLNQVYPNNWFGKNGPLRWPPRSPDLTPVDFFLWGHIKNVVYFDKPNDPYNVIARIHAAATLVDAEMLERVRVDIVRRAQACLEADGGHFEHL